MKCDLINQYIIFSKVYDEQRKLYGITQKAVTETIRICKDRNILKEYLESKEKEVVSIMMSLFNQEDIMRSYIKSERHDADVESARRMLKMGKIKIENVSDCFPDLNSFEIQKLESEMLQMA